MNIDLVISLAMFFGGFVGSLCIMYLKRITESMDGISVLVRDIDKRVVRLEEHMK